MGDVQLRPAPRPPLRVVLAAPRGFCAGVRRAIDAVTQAIDHHGAPVYVRRAIVHNLAVVRELEARGAIFVQEVDEVPPGAVLILSAHGVTPGIAQAAEQGGRRVIDATCPLVAKVHREVVRHHRDGRHVILIGHADHPEIEGTLGQLPPGAADVIASSSEIDALDIPPAGKVAFAVQTTFSVDEADGIAAALGARFADLAGPSGSDICYATTNRQAALRAIAPSVDAIIVVGESFSSNANRLAEVAAAQGCESVQLVAGPEELDWSAVEGRASIGVTAAASTPESSVSAVLDGLRARFDLAIEEIGSPIESAHFRPVRVA
ncbi:4-hydroxy-3-methylbut-2-enyl diphosphate reductase [Sphingosinicella sp. BN140058]|nr:4-hydroxy-3-methylbut-2-enyl diphosphate reductase [Sphingosinicella sp. BN140058]